MEKQAHLICPRCGQDYVVTACIKGLGETIVICPECYAVWPNMEAVLRPEASVYGVGFVDHQKYLERFGLDVSDVDGSLDHLQVEGIPWRKWDDSR